MKPGYKQTEVGFIPEEWEVKSLSELASLYQPQTISAKEFTETGFPVYGANGVVGNYHSANHETWQVTVTCRGSTCGTVNRTVERCWITGNAMVLNCDHNKRLNKEFFYHLMLGQDMSDCITGTGQPQIVRSPLAAFRVALPRELPEQRAIATALSDVDGLLGGLDRLIAKKRDLKQAAMQQLLTAQTRLPGFKGEWKRIKFGELCEYVEGAPTLGGDTAYLEIGDVDVEAKSYDIELKDKLSVRGSVLVPAGTLLISTVRPTRGAIVKTKTALHVSSAFCRVRPVNGLLFHLMCQPKFLAFLGENSIGGTYPTCRDETILAYESVLPSDPAEQSAIAEVLTDMDAELAALEQRRAKTRALKQAIMQELLTGQTRLVNPNNST